MRPCFTSKRFAFMMITLFVLLLPGLSTCTWANEKKSPKNAENDEQEDPGKLLRDAVSREYAIEGTLGLYFKNKFDFEGEIGIYFPIVSSGSSTLYFRGNSFARLIRQKDRLFTMDDEDYSFGFGASGKLPGNLEFDVFYRVYGAEGVDRKGSERLDFALFSLQSGNFNNPVFQDKFRWKASAGPVAYRKGAEADFMIEDQVEGYFLRAGGWKLGGDARFLGIFSAGRHRSEAAVGPRLSLLTQGGGTTSLFVHYVRGNNPSGIEGDGVIAGCSFELTGGGMQESGLPSPQAARLVCAGTTDGRRYSAAELRSEWKLGAVRDAPLFLALEGSEANMTGRPQDLFFDIEAGAYVESWKYRIGGFVYHRSNHLLNTAFLNDKRSINVLGFSAKTLGYDNFLPSGGFHMGAPRKQWVFHYILQSGMTFDTSLGRPWTSAFRAGFRSRRVAGSVVPYIEGSAFLFKGFEAYELLAGLRMKELWGIFFGYSRDNQLVNGNGHFLLGLDILLRHVAVRDDKLRG